MIYKIDVKDDYTVDVDMTFTAPSCPAADFILEDVHEDRRCEDVKSANVNLVFRARMGSEHDERRSKSGTWI